MDIFCVFYTGIGAREDGLHTASEFLKIMNEEFNDEQFTLKDWMEWSGATLQKIDFDFEYI
jgi:hypothetical protein